MNHISKSLFVLAVASSLTAAVVTLVSLPVLADRFSLTWGGEFYLLTPLPYVVLLIQSIVFRGTTFGATVSLIGALLLGGVGICVTYTAKDAMSIAMLPFTLCAGCGVVVVTQLVRWAITRRPSA